MRTFLNPTVSRRGTSNKHPVSSPFVITRVRTPVRERQEGGLGWRSSSSGPDLGDSITSRLGLARPSSSSSNTSPCLSALRDMPFASRVCNSSVLFHRPAPTSPALKCILSTYPFPPTLPLISLSIASILTPPPPRSRLRPRTLPERTQGLQGTSTQGQRCRGPGPDLQPAQDPQVPRGDRPRLLASGVREHGRRGRGPGARQRRQARRRRRGLAGRGGRGGARPRPLDMPHEPAARGGNERPAERLDGYRRKITTCFLEYGATTTSSTQTRKTAAAADLSDEKERRSWWRGHRCARSKGRHSEE